MSIGHSGDDTDDLDYLIGLAQRGYTLAWTTRSGE